MNPQLSLPNTPEKAATRRRGSYKETIGRYKKAIELLSSTLDANSWRPISTSEFTLKIGIDAGFLGAMVANEYLLAKRGGKHIQYKINSEKWTELKPELARTLLLKRRNQHKTNPAPDASFSVKEECVSNPPLVADQPIYRLASIDERIEAFKETVRAFSRANEGKYTNEMYKVFISYWTERDENAKKFRREKQDTWNLSARLQRWHDNDQNWKGSFTPQPEAPKVCVTDQATYFTLRLAIDGTISGHTSQEQDINTIALNSGERIIRVRLEEVIELSIKHSSTL